MLKKRSVIFFTDYGPTSGNGHLSRCLTLKNLFKKKYNVEIITKNKIPKLSGFSKNHNCSVNKFLKKNKKIYNYALIDNYKINLSTEKKIKNICKKLISLDDYQRKVHVSDFVINYSPSKNYKKFYINNNKQTKYLLGDRYNFIRNFPGKLKKTYKKNHINIFLYLGNNPKRKKIIKKILLITKNKKIVKNIYIVGYKNFKIPLKNVKYFKIVSKKKFMSLMETSDILILSAGLSLYEGVFLKKKIFSMCVAQNQKPNYDYFFKKNKIKNIKKFKQFINNSPNKIIKEINSLKKFNNKQYIKNNGLKNIKNLIRV